MARYEINYLIGDTEYVAAEGVEYDPDAKDYTFYAGSNGHNAVALIPVANVRSIVRQAEAVTG